MNLNRNKAIVVFSGGQDSTTCLYLAIQEHGGENVTAISFNYGQRHAIELEAAQRIVAMANVKHEIIDIPPELLLSTSPLTSDAQLAQYTDHDSMAAEVGNNVEKTFVPMRNSLFLTIAANRAVAYGAANIYTGVCEADNANYPDCTSAFVDSIQNSINESLGLNEHDALDNDAVVIATPLIHSSKANTVRLAYSMPECWEAMAYTHTSYDGKYPPTDMNHANILRAKGFEDAGLPDPLVVRAWKEGVMPLPDSANYNSTFHKGA